MNNKSDRHPRPSSFELIALQLGCQDDEAEFDKRLRAIATVGVGRDRGKVARDEGEGGGQKATAPDPKGE